MNSQIVAAMALVIGMAAAQNSVAAFKPTLEENIRIKTIEPISGGSQLINDPFGQPLLVSVHSLSSGAYEVVANDRRGQLVQTVFRARGTGQVSIVSATLNLKNDVIALIKIQNDPGEKLYLTNISQNQTNTVDMEGRYLRMEGEINHDGRELMLVSGDLGTGENDLSTVLLRLIDKNTGKTIRQKMVEGGGAMKMGVSSDKKLRILIRQHNGIAVWDTGSNQMKDLAPILNQPSKSSPTLESVLGRIVLFDDGVEAKILNEQDLLDGQVLPVQTFPTGSTLLGDEASYGISIKEPARFVIVKKETHIEVRDLLGKHPTGMINKKSSGIRHAVIVDDVVEKEGQLIALVSEPRVPDSFLPGTILTYINLTTSDILRISVSDQDSVTGQLLVNWRPGIYSVECTATHRGEPRLRLVEVMTNQTLTENKDIQLISNAFLSRLGEPLALRANGKAVCLTNLLDLQEETCINDPLITSDIAYDYGFVSLKADQVTLPLTRRTGANLEKLGIVQFVLR